jgi:hypothetical protein
MATQERNSRRIITPSTAAIGKPFFLIAAGFAELGLTGSMVIGLTDSPWRCSADGECPIAFFTASQIVAREKGFSMISKIPSFSARNPTALGS